MAAQREAGDPYKAVEKVLAGAVSKVLSHRCREGHHPVLLAILSQSELASFVLQYVLYTSPQGFISWEGGWCTEL